MVIAQPVEDQFELSSGRSHRTDVAVAAAMSHLFSDRADVTGIGQAVEQGFPPRGARRSVMTATGLVVTDLSHLDVGLNRPGDFRRPVRFAVSSKPSRPARRQSVPPQVMRPYNHPSRLCAASSRASHNSMPGLQPARSRCASAAIWSAVSASATSRQPVGSHGCGQPGGNRRPGLGPGAGQAGAAACNSIADFARDLADQALNLVTQAILRNESIPEYMRATRDENNRRNQLLRRTGDQSHFIPNTDSNDRSNEPNISG